MIITAARTAAMTLQELKALRRAPDNRNRRRVPTGKQLVGRTLSLELPAPSSAAARRPGSGVRKEHSALGLARPGSAALRLNTLDSVSSVYKLPGPGPAAFDKAAQRRSVTPSEGSRRRVSTDALAGRSPGGPAGEVLGALVGLDSLSSAERAEACKELLLKLAAHEPAYKEILERVQLEHEEERDTLAREATSSKKSLAGLRAAQKRAEEALAELKKENQKLRLEATAAAEASQQLQEEAAQLNRENLETKKRLAELDKSGGGGITAQQGSEDIRDLLKKSEKKKAPKADEKDVEPDEAGASKASPEAEPTKAGASGTESVVLDGVHGEAYEPSEEEVIEYAVQLGMELPQDSALLHIAIEALKACATTQTRSTFCTRLSSLLSLPPVGSRALLGLDSPLPAAWKPCSSPEGDIYYFNFDTGESLWDRPDIETHKARFLLEKAKLLEGGAEAEAVAAAAAAVAAEGEGAAVAEEPSAAAIAAAHETSSSEEEEGEDNADRPKFDWSGEVVTLELARPDSVPALDFEALAAKVKEQEEEEKAAEEEAKRLANLPLPAGWETAVVRDHSAHTSSFCAAKHGGISADGSVRVVRGSRARQGRRTTSTRRRGRRSTSTRPARRRSGPRKCSTQELLASALRIASKTR